MSVDDDSLDELVAAYLSNEDKLALFLEQLRSAVESSTVLSPYIHTIRSRLKDPGNLRDKLQRKADAAEQAGTVFDISAENLLTRINDLAGLRILHLYTRQFGQIDHALRDIFSEQSYELIEGPFARTWDDEYRSYFSSLGIETQESPSMYTSVHYVIGSASRSPLTCEIQVRTLMEEVWGEVDHAINYPLETDIMSSKEQIKVLARVTSSATRLVDSIFLTHGTEAE